MNPFEFLIGIAPVMLLSGAIIVALGGLLYLAAYGAFALWVRHRLVSPQLHHQFAMGVLIGLPSTILSIWGWTRVPSENLYQAIFPLAGMALIGVIAWAAAVLAVREARSN